MLMRAPVRRNVKRQAVIQSKAIPFPVEGWDASSPLASMSPKRAVQLKNWFPQPGWGEVRRGYRWQSWDLGSDPRVISNVDTDTDVLTSAGHGLADDTAVKVYATSTLPGGLSATRIYYVVSATTDTFQLSSSVGGAALGLTSAGSGTISVFEIDEPPVETLAVWQGPSGSKLFAAAGNAIWDVTATAAASLAYATSITENRWQWTMHTTSGGHYLFMVNGIDAPVHYNGTSWAAPTINNITAADIVHVVVHKKRLWFVLNNATKAAYLATEAIQGDASTFELGSEFTKGGYLQAIASWSRDGGSGMDDYLVFISSEGQCVIYQGTDPDSAETWSKVGTFDLARPIGRRCFAKYGADLLLITVGGVMPLSKLLAVDASVDDLVAITQRISKAFNDQARASRTNFGWEVCIHDTGTMLIVNIPTAENSRAVQYVMNTLTQAWCEFDNHNANCWAIYNGSLYFGGSSGDVYRADTGRADIDQPITAVGQTAYSGFGTPLIKQATMVRPLITVTGSNRPSLGISTDFAETQSLSQLPAGSASSGALWDQALWDVAQWGGQDIEINDWANVVGIGTFLSVKFQAVTGSQSGGALWGVAVWGQSLWGSQGTADETMRIQGFLARFQVGGPL